MTFSISRISEFFMSRDKSHDPCISLDLGKAVFLQKICSQSIFNRDFLDLPTSAAHFSSAKRELEIFYVFGGKASGKAGKAEGPTYRNRKREVNVVGEIRESRSSPPPAIGIPRWRLNLFREFCFALLRKMSSSASDWHCGIQNCFNILVMEY